MSPTPGSDSPELATQASAGSSPRGTTRAVDSEASAVTLSVAVPASSLRDVNELGRIALTRCVEEHARKLVARAGYMQAERKNRRGHVEITDNDIYNADDTPAKKRPSKGQIVVQTAGYAFALTTEWCFTQSEKPWGMPAFAVSLAFAAVIFAALLFWDWT